MMPAEAQLRLLDATDARVLASLVADPLGSFEQLGESAGLSPSGTLKRIRKLVESGILSKEFVRSQVNYAAVGLETVVVLVDSRPAMWKAMEAACDAHPYTQYRIRVMGSVNGFLVVFSIPAFSMALLLEFLSRLKELGVIESYSVHQPVSSWGHSETKFSGYDPVANSWKFSWDEWEAKIEGSLGTHPLPSASILHKLDQTDIGILRALSIDSRGEKKTLAEKLGIKDYELSRRLRFVTDSGLVSFHRVTHETGILGIAMTIALKCKAPLDYTGRVLNSASEFPFQGSFYPLEDGFLLIANIPPGDVTSLVTLMQRHCESVELMWGDYNSSMKYFFDNEPSNFSAGRWNTDQRYVVEAPIEDIGNLIADAKTAGLQPKRSERS